MSNKIDQYFKVTKNTKVVPKNDSVICKPKKLQQLFLNVGQKQRYAVTCGVCGCVYVPGVEDDDKLHVKHHAAYLKMLNECLRLSTAVKAACKQVSPEVLMLRMSERGASAKSWCHKLEQLILRELGFTDIGDVMKSDNCVIYMHVDGDTMQVPVKTAYRARLDGATVVIDSCLNQEMCTCECGVAAVFVYDVYRHKGIASKLLKSLKESWYSDPSNVLDPSRIAFSEPTPAGFALAQAFFSSDIVLVYRELSSK